ncbi:MAG: zf-HC2 domain-containing protein [Bacteroidetes bacterium]|nr:zf-HC2 domain-containing protein [Bacteroidota bacterium]
MNCLNREEVQAFADNEMSFQEMESFRKHIETCENCRNLLMTAQKESAIIRNLLATVEPEEIVIPLFRPSLKKRKQRIGWIASSAAAIIIIMISIWTNNQNKAREKAHDAVGRRNKQISLSNRFK